MKLKNLLLLSILFCSIYFLMPGNVSAGPGSSILVTPSTDTSYATIAPVNGTALFYFFDLRDRESFIQYTYTDMMSLGTNGQAHIQIFDVSNNCNENDFFDTFTPIDTHTYNMRDILTNDGNPSGVVLPDDAYGIVAISFFVNGENVSSAIGNLRVLDNNGYEYRTNAQMIFNVNLVNTESQFYSFNYNSSGISLSDIVGVTANLFQSGQVPIEWDASNVTESYFTFDIDIIDNNETLFSCRDVIYSCVNQDNPLLEELLEIGGASVASFEYGINNALPHSKGGELLCPGNIIPEGIVILRPMARTFNPEEQPVFVGFVGLNNGNGRGSMDSFWTGNIIGINQ